ncbi:MAG TPA: fibronectin type III domain-containing protein [Elusimicrobiales bacterium]|nr:fibronectin type III domain-containing protein [Elusimicrobiales bacterium]
MSISSDTATIGWTIQGGSTPDMLISTQPALLGAAIRTGELDQNSTTYAGLYSNATYYFKVGVGPDYSAIVSSATDAAEPVLPVFDSVDINQVRISWGDGNNLPGTLYLAETGDEAFIANSSAIAPPGKSVLFTSLIPDSTYFFRIKALGVAGRDSAFLNIGSTVTRANPPAGGVFELAYSTGFVVAWSPNSNHDWTNYRVQVSSRNIFDTFVSTVVAALSYEPTGLLPDTVYYARAWAVNGAGVASAEVPFGSTVTLAAVPVAFGPVWYTDGVNSVTAKWDPHENPIDTEYHMQVSSAADFTGADYGPAGWAVSPLQTAVGLFSGREYYFRVKARNRLGRETGYFYIGHRAGPSGPDITAPTTVDWQEGDNVWRSGASGLYMVHFADASKVDRFQVRVATGPQFTGQVIADWTDVVTAIDAESYATDWPLPAEIFSGIPQAATSYVSVRVYDQAGNVAVSSDVFYVLRDTTTPAITDGAASPAGWLNSDPGLFNVDFFDALSGLKQVLYSVSNQANSNTPNVKVWTEIAAFSSSSSYTADWGVDFSALEDGASNYVSARAIDNAGNSYTLKDVFRILKNTIGPNIVIANPAGALVSTVTAFSGTATAMNEVSPVASVEITLQDLTAPASHYYDGTDFLSDTPVWLSAAGQALWSYNASAIAFAPLTQYQLRARAWDANGLPTAPLSYSVKTFQISQIVPTVALSTPVAGSTVAVFDAAGGTASDGGGAALGAVEVYVKQLYNNKWWNFETDAWGETMVASATAAGAAWNFTPGARLRGALVNNQQYFITARATDISAPPNASAYAVPGATFTCVDTMAPQQITQLTASTGTAPGRINLAWTFAGDDGGALPIPFGEYAVQYATFSAAAFSTTAANVLISTGLVLPGAAQLYTVAGLAPNGTYYLELWVADDAGLWSPASPQVTTMAGESLNNEISGTVKTPLGVGVAGIVVEAYSNTGVLSATTYTLDDNLGSFTLTNLADGLYRVQATLVENGFESSIAKDQMPMGYSDVNFVLSIAYELAGISGVVPLAAPAGFRPAAAGAGSEVQLWQNGRKVYAVYTDAAGRFAINNLIPGIYTLKVLDAGGVWRSVEVKLVSGQVLRINPLQTLLKKDAVYAYPNPARDHVKFHVETDINANPVQAEISVFTLDGRLTERIAQPAALVNDYLWNFTGGKPASGVYFYTVRLRDEATGKVETTTRKFAVLR